METGNGLWRSADRGLRRRDGALRGERVSQNAPTHLAW